MPTPENKTAALSENIANRKHAKAVRHVAVEKKKMTSSGYCGCTGAYITGADLRSLLIHVVGRRLSRDTQTCRTAPLTYLFFLCLVNLYPTNVENWASS
jgi:hypothetical protein